MTDIALAIINTLQIQWLIEYNNELKDLKSFLKERKDQILPETIQKLEYLTGWKVFEN
jgi:hypothetical protein